MQNKIKIIKKIGTITNTTAAIKKYKKFPGDLNLAATAAVSYAKKYNLNMLVVQGNSYGNKIYHILNYTDDISKITVINTNANVLLAKPNGSVYSAIIYKKTAESVKLKSLIEKLGITYDYSSIQVNLPQKLSNKMIAWSKENIPTKSIYIDDSDPSLGRENEIHFTILYGIEEEIPTKTFRLLKNIKPFTVKLGKVTKFYTKNYDVIKIDVESKYLEKLHYFLEKNIDNTNSYPIFHGHITLAYVKKGKLKNLIGNSTFTKIKLPVNKLTFSSKNGKFYFFKLN